ncbi:MAG: hypothetical protein ACE5KM_19420 [Planctomycetaceae bacterium]
MPRTFALLIPALLVTLVAAAAPDPKLPPIKRIKDAKPKKSIFKTATRKKPLVLKSQKDAAKYFGKVNLANLKKQVDFTQQFVLVFAWRGSGGDRFRVSVAESYPEQISFHYKPGRTRDLRPHVYVYVLRSNVKWRVR